MNEQANILKKAILFCTCSGACPSMTKIDFWALAERVRLELGDKLEFMALHPRLCEENGERFMRRILSSDICFITAACLPKKQEKLLRQGFDGAGVPMDHIHWVPVGMGMEDTNTVFDKIKAALESADSVARP
jgi:heterodisulfide reductase subunit A-like polyferredoxin